MAPATQKAIVTTQVGEPFLTLDQKGRDFGLFTTERLPCVHTADITGHVVELGPEVSKYAVGDHIFGQGAMDPKCAGGGLQEYAVLDTDYSCKIPNGITDEEAATIPVCSLTPTIAMFGPAMLALPAPWSPEKASFDYLSKPFLIVGGGSNCGIFAVQLAALAGFDRIIVVGGNDEYLISLGATHVLSRHESPDAVLNRIRNLVGDDLLYAIDVVSPPEGQALSINALSSTKRGKFVRLNHRGPVSEALIHPKKKGYELLDVIGEPKLTPEVAKPFWAALPQHLKEGKIKPIAFSVRDFTPEDVNAVFDAYKEGKKVPKTHFRQS